MTPHSKIYFQYFDYTDQSEVICEACGRQASDIHYINGRGKGKNEIKNLIALCRKCNERTHGTKNYVSKEQFQLIHNYFLQGTRKAFLK